jgi:hypothetical protein
MPNLRALASHRPAAALVILGLFPTAAWAGDLSSYRDFQLGSDLTAVAKHAGIAASEATVVHLRPALIQELQWRPRSLGPANEAESARDVVFTFYDGKLFQITVKYDRYDTEGLTTEDMVGVISATYGAATKPAAVPSSTRQSYGNDEEVLARWQDPQYRFELIRFSYGPTFRLVGTLKQLEARAQAAMLEALRLDEKEKPQREAARIAEDEAAAEAKLDKARLANKPKFRP